MRYIKTITEPGWPDEEVWEPDDAWVTCQVCGEYFDVLDDAKEFDCPKCKAPHKGEYNYKREKYEYEFDDKYSLCLKCGTWKLEEDVRMKFDGVWCLCDECTKQGWAFERPELWHTWCQDCGAVLEPLKEFNPL